MEEQEGEGREGEEGAWEKEGGGHPPPNKNPGYVPVYAMAAQYTSQAYMGYGQNTTSIPAQCAFESYK